MKKLRCISTINIGVLGLFVYVGIINVAGQSIITADIATYDVSSIKTYNDHCECIKYDCGCCQYMEWDEISLNGTLCANATYLEHDYGISVTLTFNKFAIINETVSARNPPPICIGEDIVDLEVEACLHIYDIDIGSNKFHACFEILGKIMKFRISKIKLGCVNSNLYKDIRYIGNNSIHQSSDLKLLTNKDQSMAEPIINGGTIWDCKRTISDLILLLFLILLFY